MAYGLVLFLLVFEYVRGFRSSQRKRERDLDFFIGKRNFFTAKWQKPCKEDTTNCHLQRLEKMKAKQKDLLKLF